MEEIARLVAMAFGFLGAVSILWAAENITYRTALSAFGFIGCILLIGFALLFPWAPLEPPKPEPPGQSAIPKSDLVSPRAIGRLFSEAQQAQAVKIEDQFQGLFNFQPPMPRARPHGRTLVWHWCKATDKLVTADDWERCRGKTMLPGAPKEAQVPWFPGPPLPIDK